MLMEVPYKPNANREDTQVENLCYGGELRGAARAREPALLTSGAMDGGAKSASSERRPGRPQQATGMGSPEPRGRERITCDPHDRLPHQGSETWSSFAATPSRAVPVSLCRPIEAGSSTQSPTPSDGSPQ